MIHPTADIEDGAAIGAECQVWHQAQVRSGAVLGPGCVLGKGAYIDVGVRVGDGCRIQNYACVFGPARLGRRVVVGPHAVVANCRFPRANLGNCRTGHVDAPVIVGDDASIGAHAVVLPGVRIGRFATIGSGAVVTRDVLPHALVYGVPARVVGVVCRCGRQARRGVTCDKCRRKR